MILSASRRRALFLCAAVVLFIARSGSAGQQDVLCDPGFQDCRTLLFQLIQNETPASTSRCCSWKTTELANAIIARHSGPASGRAILIEPRRNGDDAEQRSRAGHVPERRHPDARQSGGGMLHWKFMIFAGQDKVQFSAANYSDYYFRPDRRPTRLHRRGRSTSHDPPSVDSFRPKFDDAWTDTAAFTNYANITAGLLAQLSGVPDRRPSSISFRRQNFASARSLATTRRQAEIDIIMYKITDFGHTGGLIRAAARGVPVRRDHSKPDRYRNKGNFWQAYSVDRLYAAGIQIRDRAHAGFPPPEGDAALQPGDDDLWFVELVARIQQLAVRAQLLHRRRTGSSSGSRTTSSASGRTRTGNAETKPFRPCRRILRSTRPRRTERWTCRPAPPCAAMATRSLGRTSLTSTSARRRTHPSSRRGSAFRPTQRPRTISPRWRPARRITGASSTRRWRCWGRRARSIPLRRRAPNRHRRHHHHLLRRRLLRLLRRRRARPRSCSTPPARRPCRAPGGSRPTAPRQAGGGLETQTRMPRKWRPPWRSPPTTSN